MRLVPASTTNVRECWPRLPFNTCFDLIQIDVALERRIALCNEAFITHQFFNTTAQLGDMCLRRSEVIVHDDATAGLDKMQVDDMLCNAPGERAEGA